MFDSNMINPIYKKERPGKEITLRVSNSMAVPKLSSFREPKSVIEQKWPWTEASQL